MYSFNFQSISLTLTVGVSNEDEGNSDDLAVMRKALKDMDNNIPSAQEWLKEVKSSPTGSIDETSIKQVNMGKIRLLFFKLSYRFVC